MLADASAKALYNTDIVIDAPVAVQDKNHGTCTGMLACVALCSCVALAAAVNPSLDSSRLWVQSRLTLQQHPTVLGAQQVDRRLPTLREGKSLWTAPSDGFFLYALQSILAECSTAKTHSTPFEKPNSQLNATPQQHAPQGPHFLPSKN